MNHDVAVQQRYTPQTTNGGDDVPEVATEDVTVQDQQQMNAGLLLALSIAPQAGFIMQKSLVLFKNIWRRHGEVILMIAVLVFGVPLSQNLHTSSDLFYSKAGECSCYKDPQYLDHSHNGKFCYMKTFSYCCQISRK